MKKVLTEYLNYLDECGEEGSKNHEAYHTVRGVLEKENATVLDVLIAAYFVNGGIILGEYSGDGFDYGLHDRASICRPAVPKADCAVPWRTCCSRGGLRRSGM